MEATRLAQALLTGWRRKLGERLAYPIARRTRLQREQVLALLGLASLVLTVRRLVDSARRRPPGGAAVGAWPIAS